MEAQPLALGIMLLTRIIVGANTSSPIGAGSIALLELGLLWWAMITQHIIGRMAKRTLALPFYLAGWLVAFAVVAGPLLPSLVRGANIFPALVDTVLITWLWRRSMRPAQAGFEYGQLATSFKVSFGVLLGILLIAILLPDLQDLRAALGSALPVFFLGGLVGLSLARLGDIRSARRATDSPQADPTRPWLLMLTVFGAALIVVVIIIESVFSFASFEFLLAALTPLWNVLGILIGWLLYGIVFLLSPLFYLASFIFGLFRRAPAQHQQQTLPKSPFAQQKSGFNISPEVITLSRWVFLAIALIVVLLVIAASVRRLFIGHNEEGVEEEREGLDARSLLGQRWREWWNRRRRKAEVAALEPLDPASARARYREMLQALAVEREELARRPAETPSEYEARILAYLEKRSSTEATGNGHEPPAHAILDELTQAYTLERYGGKRTGQDERAYLQTWVPRLLQRLTGKAPARLKR